MSEEGLDQLLADRYDQKLDDIRAWLAITQWDRKRSVSKKLINEIQNKLVRFRVIEQHVHYKDLIKKIF